MQVTAEMTRKWAHGVAKKALDENRIAHKASKAPARFCVMQYNNNRAHLPGDITLGPEGWTNKTRATRSFAR